MKEPQRGDLVTASLPGAYGKSRPALEPSPANGLRALSQVMTDKISTLPRAKVSAPFGRLGDERMKAVDRALLLAIGVI